jgi:3-deoxy-D-manno-octulosonate 8-phosphate phosphatase (KDO 8-P phosphatase)
MKSYKELLPTITTFIFDVDGVFTDGTVQILPNGELIRTFGVRDSYAVQYAVKKGYNIAIITGGNSMAVKESLGRLGVDDVFLSSKNKLKVFENYLSEKGIKQEEVLYMGDDIPDYDVMKRSGVSACPADAAVEIKSISRYISNKNGGKGCVRDIIEQTLRVQGKWFDYDALEW